MKALQHNYPQWEYDRDRGEDVLSWGGHMRVVRSRKRMRRLKRRGVPLMHLGYGDGTAAQQERSPRGNLVAFGPWAWFETFEHRETRMQARHERAQARFIKRNWAELEAHTFAGMDLADGPDRTVKWWVEVGESTPQDRAARKAPPVTLFIGESS